MTRKGFTLIELLVVIVIIGILVAIALPNFIKIKDKAKEAEVKQNLHAIQLALERYSTDADGNYPYFLYGGDALFNIGTIYGMDAGIGDHPVWEGPCIQPFDMFALPHDGWNYSEVAFGNLINEPDDLDATFGDTLAYEGYMPKYPGNPFQIGSNAQSTFGLESFLAFAYNAYACWGGKDGHKMFNVGWLSEMNQLQQFTSYDTSDLIKPGHDFAGNFAYHARWSDGITNREHLMFQIPFNPNCYQLGTDGNPLLDHVDDVSSLDVAGYDLIATGSPRTRGDDLDNSILIDGVHHFFRTGYLTLGQERNPFVRAGEFPLYPDIEDYDERPESDGVWDFTIIHLSSGLDKKSGNPTDDAI